jgi:hypothetical protein
MRPVLYALVAFLCLSCSPRLLDDRGFDLNPVEILDKSPRIYHIKFESIGDSVEMARVSTYLAGSTLLGVGEPRFDLSAPGVSSEEAIARLEYVSAREKLEAGDEEAALGHLKNALDADPAFVPPFILLGWLLLDEHRPSEALPLFTRAVEADAADSDALVGLGRCYMLIGMLSEARKVLVDAVIFNRVNLEAWSSLHELGTIQGFSVVTHDALDLGLVRKAGGRHYDIVIDADLEGCPVQTAAWIVYSSQRAVWRYEAKYRRYIDSMHYLRTYHEDIDCYMALAAAWKVLSESDSTVCEAGYLEHLDKVASEGYLVPHVLFDYVCLEEPFAARRFTVDVINQLRGYVNRYVTVPES